MLFNLGLDFPERNTFAKAFYCSGYASGAYDTQTETFLSVTGVEYQNVIVGTGITGYVPASGVTTTSNGSSVTGFFYSGVTDKLMQQGLSEKGVNAISGTLSQFAVKLSGSEKSQFSPEEQKALRRIVTGKQIGRAHV